MLEKCKRKTPATTSPNRKFTQRTRHTHTPRIINKLLIANLLPALTAAAAAASSFQHYGWRRSLTEAKTQAENFSVLGFPSRRLQQSGNSIRRRWKILISYGKVSNKLNGFPSTSTSFWPWLHRSLRNKSASAQLGK